MLMIVLSGLAYEICEGYIDDIIIHGQSEPDLVQNLRKKVFVRCRNNRIPRRVVRSEGMHFSAEQLSEVAQFPTQRFWGWEHTTFVTMSNSMQLWRRLCVVS